MTAILTLPLNLRSSFPLCDPSSETADGGTSSFRLGLAQTRILALINRHREKWGLQPKTGLYTCDSELAQITQLPIDFDFQQVFGKLQILSNAFSNASCRAIRRSFVTAFASV